MKNSIDYHYQTFKTSCKVKHDGTLCENKSGAVTSASS